MSGHADPNVLTAVFPKTATFAIVLVVASQVVLFALLFSIFAHALHAHRADDDKKDMAPSAQVSQIYEAGLYFLQAFGEYVDFKRKVKRFAPGLYQRWYGRKLIATKSKKLVVAAESNEKETMQVEKKSPTSGIQLVGKDEMEEDPEKSQLVRSIEVMAGRALRRMTDLEREMERAMTEAKETVSELQGVADGIKIQLEDIIDN
jgi:hypothetical protein